MAKKLKCSGCATLIDIDVTKKILVCPNCGKKFKNSHYEDPAAAPKEEPAKAAETQADPKVAETPAAPKVEEKPAAPQAPAAQKLQINCPACKTKVSFTSDDEMIVCPVCGKSYKNVMYRGPKKETPAPVQEEKPAEAPKIEEKPIDTPLVEDKKEETTAPADDFSLDGAFDSSLNFSKDATSVQFTKDESASAIATERKAEPIVDAPKAEEKPVETPAAPVVAPVEEKKEDIKVEDMPQDLLGGGNDDLGDLKETVDAAEEKEEETEKQDKAPKEKKIKVAKENKSVGKLSKKAAITKIVSGVFLMLISMAVIGLTVWSSMDDKESIKTIFTSVIDALKNDPSEANIFALFYYLYVIECLFITAIYALYFFITSAMTISIGDIMNKSIKTGEDCSNKIKSAKLAGYGIALAFSLIFLIVDGLQLYYFVKPMVEGTTAVLDGLKDLAQSFLPVLLFKALIVGYFSYKIDYVSKK